MSVAENPLQLSELSQLIQATIEGTFREQRYQVIAETTGIAHYPAKSQCYLTLIEKCDSTNTIKASLKARIWGQRFACIQLFEETTGQVFKDNIQVLLRVRVHYHAQYGLSLDIEDIDCNFTIGKLALTRQAVVQKLLDENPEHIKEVDGEYLTFNKKLNFPPVIQKIALISSAQADGYADFLHELHNNQYGYGFCVDEYLAPVQGQEAHKEIYKQLVKIFESGVKYDAVVLVRGGGSQLDFQAYDSYMVSRAVARFPIPVITGIGHEKNESVCDLMARLKTKTPTKAAATIVAHNHQFSARLQQLQKQIILKTNEIIISQELVLNAVQNVFISQTKDLLNQEQKDLKEKINTAIHAASQHLQHEKVHLLRVQFNLQCNTENCIKNEKFRLQNLSNSLQHLDPKNVLKRGFAMVYKNGKIITNSETLEKNDIIQTRFYTGDIDSKVL